METAVNVSRQFFPTKLTSTHLTTKHKQTIPGTESVTTLSQFGGISNWNYMMKHSRTHPFCIIMHKCALKNGMSEVINVVHHTKFLHGSGQKVKGKWHWW